MNEIHVTVRGNVAGDPRQWQFDDGSSMTSFRLASTARRFDSGSREWVDQGTTFLTVVCRRALALNVLGSVRKGQPVVVSGRLRERFWTAKGQQGRVVEVLAEGLGHDLAYGTSEFARVVRAERVRDVAADEMAYEHAQEAAKEAAAGTTGDVTDVSDLPEAHDPDVPMVFAPGLSGDRGEGTAPGDVGRTGDHLAAVDRYVEEDEGEDGEPGRGGDGDLDEGTGRIAS